MIAGAILLAASLIIALVHRLGQAELAGQPGKAILIALADTVGITGIVEAFGNDIVTGKPLTDAERTERGVLGAFTLVTLIFGARAAFKGPPGGAFTRPVGSVPGWGGFGVFGRAVEGAKGVAVEIASAISTGVRSVREWWAGRGRSGTGEPKVQEPTVEEPKVEEPKVEEPKVEEPKVEEPKVEEPKVEEPKVEEPKEPIPAEQQYAACFVAGTLVDLGGDTCPIEAVSAGDLVLGRPADDGEDEDGDRDGSFRVTTVHRSRTSRIVRLRAGADVLVCTRGHPFSVAGRGWVAAADLRADDVLDGDGGSTTTLTAVEDVRLPAEATTFNFEVQTACTYFVRIGERSVLVHNGGPDPFNFDQTLYWLLGKGPNLRPTDVDGLSTWKTSSRAEVQKLMEARVNIDGRSVKDPHSFYTPEQLESAGIKPTVTPGDGTLAELGFEHNSLRPAEVADPKAPLSVDEMAALKEKLGAAEPVRVKPNQVKC
jgi:hypothetical protein